MTTEAAQACVLPQAGMFSKRRRARSAAHVWTVHRVHKWAGLLAALWLAVLGLTGFFLDHRDWRWMSQPVMPAAWLAAPVAEKSLSGAISLYQVNPQNALARLAGGLRGLWASADGGRKWAPVRFEGLGVQPQVLAIVPDPGLRWQRLWLATDDGVWLSADGGHRFARYALAGQRVTALTPSGQAGMLGVTDRSRVFRLATEGSQPVAWLDLQPLAPHLLPANVDLSRFVHDLHFGRGVFSGAASLLLNDLAAIALVLLPLTGLLYWAMPKRWKRRRRSGRETPAHVRVRSIRWLYRLHGPLAGVAALVPIVYLALTGILIDHGKELGPWMRAVPLVRDWLPPVYSMSGWQGEIYAVAGYPGAADALSIGTRAGLFTSTDGGRTWSREAGVNGFVWMMRRADDSLFIGGMGSPSYVKRDGGTWQRLQQAGHMPSDASVLPGGGWLVKTRHGARMTGASGKMPAPMPPSPDATWFDIIDGLHSGLLIHGQWKWMNDLFSVAAVLLVLTGIPRVWRRGKPSLGRRTKR